MNLFIPQSRIYSSKIFATTAHGSQGSRQHGQCLRFLLARIPTRGHSRLPCLLQRRTRTLQDFLGPRRSEKDSIPRSAGRTPCRQFLELPSAILSRGALPVETGSLTKRVFKGLTLLTPNRFLLIRPLIWQNLLRITIVPLCSGTPQKLLVAKCPSLEPPVIFSKCQESTPTPPPTAQAIQDLVRPLPGHNSTSS